MKNLFILVSICILCTSFAFGQLNSNVQNSLSVNTDGSNADPSAILHVQDTARGILIPNLTTNQRLNIASPANGLLVRDLEEGNFWYWDGGKWVNMGEPRLLTDNDGDTEVNVGDPFDSDEIVFITDSLLVIRIQRNAVDKATILTFEGSQSNILIGQEAGANLDAFANVIIGASAAQNMPSGGGNVIIGESAAKDAPNAFNSVIVGSSAGTKLDGGDCTFIGAFSGQNSTGGENTYIGSGAGLSDTSGSQNVYVGRYAGQNAQGFSNAYFGYGSGSNDTSGVDNSFIGLESGSISSSSNSIYIGARAGRSAQGNNNIFIGPAVGDTNAESNRLMINNNSDTALIWGAFDSRRIGIDRVATTNTLEVNGDASKASAGDWLANSDERLKKNIQKLDSKNILDQILDLQGVTYEWNDQVTGTKRPKGIQYGFTAQNIQEVFPELVKEDALGYLQTPYGTYDAMTIEAIRALDNKISGLENENQRLKRVNYNLESRLKRLEGIVLSLNSDDAVENTGEE